MFKNNFTRWHALVTCALWLVFAALTLVIALRGLDHAAQRPLTVAATVAGSALGPMSGAISRGFQPCCLAFSLSLMPICLAALAVATAPPCGPRFWVTVFVPAGILEAPLEHGL